MDDPHSTFLDDDKHICLRCKRTIVGLDNYVIHRKSHCHEVVNPPPPSVPHLPRESIVETFTLQSKSNVEDSSHITEPFSSGAIDLSTSTKRDLNDNDHQQNILFTNITLSSSSDHKSDHTKLAKAFSSTETYPESYSEVDSYHSGFVTSRDQPLFLDYRAPTSTDPIRKEVFVGQQHFTSSGDIFQAAHHEPSSITLFRPFDAFSEHFKGNPDVVDHGSYFSQAGNKYISESNSFENKISDIYSTIHSGAENENFLAGENNIDGGQFKRKLLEGSNGISAHDYHKPICYEESSDKGKEPNPVLQECNEQDSCSVALDCSKQDLRQNDFLSSLELTSTVARKMMKYESDIDEDEDYYESRPPGHHTGGKWPPGTHSHPSETGKWMFSPPNVEEDSQDGFETLNDNDNEQQQSFQPPPPSYTKGKWLPGKRMTNVKYGTSVEYECKSCDRILKGKTAYEKHLRSELHFVKENKTIGLSTKPSLLPKERPTRAKKEKAQIFLKQKISQIKRKRNKDQGLRHLRSSRSKREEVMPKVLRKKCVITPSTYANEETDEEIERNVPKILCPICRLSFSEAYCSQHFASLAHIHNELEFNTNPNCETNKAYNKIILKNIKSLVKASNFFCKPCNFFTNSHSDLQYHLNLSHGKEEEKTGGDMKIIYKCSACSDENSLYTLADLQRHLKVSQHRQNIEFEILEARQIVIHQFLEIVCAVCQRGFRYNKAYREHRRKFHGEEGFQLVNQRLSQCSECPYQGINERQVRSHLKNEHFVNYSKFYFCFVCGLRFPSRSEADSHRHSTAHRITLEKQKGKSTSRTCNICYSVLENLTVLRQHMTEHHRKDVTPCPYCGIVPPLRFDLTVHRKACTRVVVVSGGTYKCDLCPYSNDLMAHVLMHMVFAHFEKEREHYICHLCKSHIQGRSVKNHMLLHTNEMKFSCNFCSRKFSEQVWLQSHLVIVHSLNLKENETSEDKVAFDKDRAALNSKEDKEDQTKNKKNRKALCEICGRTYTNRSHLKRHQHLHVDGSVTVETRCKPTGNKISDQRDDATSSKSFVCEVCGIVCKNTSEFKSHRQGHRSSELEGSSFPCPHCSYSTPRMHHLRRHLRLHTGANPFKCPYCSYAANNQENLRKHMLKTQRHPGRRMYECQLCLQRNADEAGQCLSPKPNKEERSPFGSNYAVDFKEHLTKRHKTHFRDKEEVMRHIRSYYHSDQDSTFTDKPKLFTYQSKRRQRKPRPGNYKTNSKMSEIVEEKVGLIPSTSGPSTSRDNDQHFEPFIINFNKEASSCISQHPDIPRPQGLLDMKNLAQRRPDISPVENPAFLISEGATSKLESRKNPNNFGCFDYGVYPNSGCHGDESSDQIASLSLPSCSSFTNDPLSTVTAENILPKRVRVFINKEAKKAYIMKGSTSSQLNLHPDVNISVGTELLKTSDLSSSHLAADEGGQTDSKSHTCAIAKAPTVASSSKNTGICQEHWPAETKVQNVVSKKVYLLVSKRRNIEDQIQDSLRWIDNL